MNVQSDDDAEFFTADEMNDEGNEGSVQQSQSTQALQSQAIDLQTQILDSLSTSSQVPPSDASPQVAQKNQWSTVGLETVKGKYIARKQVGGAHEAVYSIVPVVPRQQDATENAQPVHYDEDLSKKFVVNVKVVAAEEDKAKEAKQRNVKHIGVGKKSSAAGRKAVGAKKPSSYLTSSARRILRGRVMRQQNDGRQHTTQGLLQEKVCILN